MLISALLDDMDARPITSSPNVKKVAVSLAALHASCFDAGWPAVDFAEHIARATDEVIGLYDSGPLIGFIIMRIIADQAEVLILAVKPDKRGMGGGAALLEYAEQAAKRRGAEIVFLDVAKDNGAGLALYQRAGYAQCGTRPGYYRRENGRVSAILYQKRL
jgi:ribosomal-protein-alanine N-acetyltransferase